MLGQPLGEIERAGAADIVLRDSRRARLERGIGLCRVVGPLQLEDQRHQRFGDEAPAEEAEMAGLVGAGADRSWGSGSSRSSSSRAGERPIIPVQSNQAQRAADRVALRQRARLTPRSRRRAASTKAAILAGSFTPGALSTPEETSTPGAPVMLERRRDVLGVQPADTARASRGRGPPGSSNRTTRRCRPDAWRPWAAWRRTECDRHTARMSGRAGEISSLETPIAFMTGTAEAEPDSATRAMLLRPCN